MGRVVVGGAARLVEAALELRVERDRASRAEGQVGVPDLASASSLAAGHLAHALARADPAALAAERHALALDGVQAHPQRGGLLRRDVADVGALLVGA